MRGRSVIKLDTADQAERILDEIWKGKLFENLELELKKEKNNDADFGIMMLSELKDDVAESLRDSKPYSKPVIVRPGPDYRRVQPIVFF